MANRTKIGVATSTKTAKTVVVTVHMYKRHPKYHKQYRTTKKFYAHDEKEKAQEGDTVTIEECRPMSKLKRWKVIDIKAGQGTVNLDDLSDETDETSTEEIIEEDAKETEEDAEETEEYQKEVETQDLEPEDKTEAETGETPREQEEVGAQDIEFEEEAKK